MYKFLAILCLICLTAGTALAVDSDGDGFPDEFDNCPFTPNALGQSPLFDQDADGIGDACDNCRTKPNPDGTGQEFQPGFPSPHNIRFYSTAQPFQEQCGGCGFMEGPNQFKGTPGALVGQQLDDDRDGIGNVCDGDFDGSGFINVDDLLDMLTAFGSSLDSGFCPDDNGVVTNSPPFSNCSRYDLSASGFLVNVSDLSIVIEDIFGKFTNTLGCALDDTGTNRCLPATATCVELRARPATAGRCIGAGASPGLCFDGARDGLECFTDANCPPVDSWFEVSCGPIPWAQ